MEVTATMGFLSSSNTNNSAATATSTTISTTIPRRPKARAVCKGAFYPFFRDYVSSVVTATEFEETKARVDTPSLAGFCIGFLLGVIGANLHSANPILLQSHIVLGDLGLSSSTFPGGSPSLPKVVYTEKCNNLVELLGS
ncbi:hypothetical protein N7462_005231 [Penicillium macrosclerotiorum]|uniref:uncharacterized protein n=1 Tax=Penicillium macrosclerotiorum TaxID=303699 RepID=UPI0025496A6C|nr:uncharacterized protein N7462_005231 [Penicillium macrosclerotiorum]KAJ5690839.1 hypothetical protein N7462_005231 [Penicillium macrosclerotiorum]